MTMQRPDPVRLGRERFDAVVIGGGPGGSATATLLAEAGLSVAILEKDRHPRFHIGESLLPHVLPHLARLGVLERVKAIGVLKPGAEFVSACGERTVEFRFARAMSPGPAHAYQVERARFDEILFRRAVEAGAVGFEETAARVVADTAEGCEVEATGPDGIARTIRGAILIDSTGRSTATAQMYREKRPDPNNTSAAIYGHWRGIERAPGDRGGNIRIHLTDPGWVWQIPLQGGVTSVGFVAPGAQMAARGNSVEAFFRAHCARHPALAAMIEGAEPVGRLSATGNFSYRAVRAYGPGHIKVGDAFGFIDPVFSTGVQLAITGAIDCAQTVLAIRARPGDRARLLEGYQRRITRRMAFVSWFIYRIHDPALRHMLMNPRDVLGVEGAVIALLAGDLDPGPRVAWRLRLFRALRHVVKLDRTGRAESGGAAPAAPDATGREAHA